MIAHGFLAALTFALTGYLHQQTGTLEMRGLGGLLRKLPFIGAVLMARVCRLRVAGLRNFPGEVTVFSGAWKSFAPVTVFACWGALLIGAIYMLRAVRNVLHGPLGENWRGLRDASNLWVKAPFIILLAALIIFGCFPRVLTDKITPRAQEIVEMAKTISESAPPLRILEALSIPKGLCPSAQGCEQRATLGKQSKSIQP